MSLTGKVWIWPDHKPDLVNKLAAELDLSPALAHLLINRGITSSRQARAYLSPHRNHLHSPWLMLGMKQAVERLKKALEQKERIVVHGDYDADGIAATAIIVETLSMLGGDVDYYLPSRFAEGYGLHGEAIKKFHEAGISLVLTVDCGINAVEEVAFASTKGIDMIVTDHHLPLTIPGEAIAVINPLQQDCPYPFKDLSGAGIALKVAQALMEEMGCSFPENLLDLAALGTVADVVPLTDENRVILSTGLDCLRTLQRTGFKALLETVQLDHASINGWSLAFILAPPVNAAGRMGEALPAAQLLLEKDFAKARELAKQLHQANIMRRATEQKILAGAEEAAAKLLSGDDKRVIVLSDSGWHHGVIGIVASRLVEKFNRPVALVALEGEEGRGSARSIPGFDITAALAASSFLLERFGGHEQAAGFTVQERNLAKLADSLDNFAKASLSEKAFRKKLNIEVELEHQEITLELAAELEQLQPHGIANPTPLLGSKSWQVQSWRLVGSERKHLKVSLKKGERYLEPIFFSGSAIETMLEERRLVDLAFRLKKGNFREEDRLEVELQDLSYSDTCSLDQVSIIDRRGSGKRSEILLRILNSDDQRPVVFVSTLARLNKIKNSAGEDHGSCFVTTANAGENNCFPQDFNTVILYDLPLHEKTLKSIFGHEGRADKLTCHLLYDKSDLRRNFLILDHSLPTFEHLEKVLKNLSEGKHLIDNNGDNNGSLNTILEEVLGFRPAVTFHDRTRKILAESGIIQYNRLNPGCDGLNLPWLDRLEQSSTYRAAKELRSSCENLQQLLLGKDLETIASFFKKLSSK